MNRAGVEKVWAAVPDVHCKGLCAESCGPISASEAELQLLAERGVTIVPLNQSLLTLLAGREVADCPALVDGRCSVYDVRPTVCRLWGAVENMVCPWGCEPDEGRLPTRDGFALLARAMAVGQLTSRRDRRG